MGCVDVLSVSQPQADVHLCVQLRALPVNAETRARAGGDLESILKETKVLNRGESAASEYTPPSFAVQLSHKRHLGRFGGIK